MLYKGTLVRLFIILCNRITYIPRKNVTYLTELPKLYDENGNIDPAELDYLMP